MDTFPSRTALVHDWLPVYAGAERVLEQIIHVAPNSEVYTLVDFIEDEHRHFLQGRSVHTSFIQNLPFAEKLYRHYLPFCPLAIEGFDLTDYDVVVSSSYVVAKGVLSKADQMHVCYMHTPVRYAWDLYHGYMRSGGFGRGLKRRIAQIVMHFLRLYDVATALRPDLLVANSRYVARRIWNTYRRRAAIVHPPVDTSEFSLESNKDDYYVTVSRFAHFKRVDILIDAFSQMTDRKLVVIGDGPTRSKLEARATPNIEFLGYQSGEALTEPLKHARAFVYAGIEDFGIAPVEAQACGTPVIAYRRGGVLETVRPGETGVFFDEQTPQALQEAVGRFEEQQFEPEKARRNAERFSNDRFKEEFANLLQEAWEKFGETSSLENMQSLQVPKLETG